MELVAVAQFQWWRAEREDECCIGIVLVAQLQHFILEQRALFFGRLIGQLDLPIELALFLAKFLQGIAPEQGPLLQAERLEDIGIFDAEDAVFVGGLGPGYDVQQPTYGGQGARHVAFGVDDADFLPAGQNL